MMSIAPLHQGEFLACVDIKDASLQIPKFMAHHQFLWFSMRPLHYHGLTIRPFLFQIMGFKFGLLWASNTSIRGYQRQSTLYHDPRDGLSCYCHLS